MSEYILGQPSPMVAQHIQDCPACRAELVNFREALGEFRGAVRAWSEDQAKPALAIPAAVPEPRSWTASHQLAWAAADCRGVRYRELCYAPARSEKAQPGSDAVLLNQVDAQVSRTAALFHGASDETGGAGIIMTRALLIFQCALGRRHSLRAGWSASADAPESSAHGAGFPPLGRPGRWWTDPALVQKLGLTADQQKRIDTLFQQSRLKLIDLSAGVQKEEAILEPLLEADRPDESQVLAQIDRIAQARAELEKANARMLLGFRGVLTLEQWKKLQAEEPPRHGEHPVDFQHFPAFGKQRWTLHSQRG